MSHVIQKEHLSGFMSFKIKINVFQIRPSQIMPEAIGKKTDQQCKMLVRR